MRTLMAAVLGVGFAAGLALVPVSAAAQSLASEPGDPSFEAALNRQIDEANAQVLRELEADATMALDRMRAETSPPEEAVPEPGLMGTVAGVPGDPRFEAQLSALIDQANEAAKEELSQDPVRVQTDR